MTITASIRHSDLQIGDVINLTDDVFIKFGKSGADTSTFWEIVGKKIKAYADEPGVLLTLAWVRDSVFQVFTPEFGEPVVIPGGGGPGLCEVVTTELFETVFTDAGDPVCVG